METSGAGVTREDAIGVLPLLLMVSGYAAVERGSELIEPRDLIKAIYIADLEHVMTFWKHWEGFERLVSDERLGTGHSRVYINRTLYLVRVELMTREAKGFAAVGQPSRTFQEVITAARKLASDREGAPSTPSSRDLLFCVCSQDSELSAALQESGLRLEELAAAVRESGCGGASVR